MAAAQTAFFLIQFVASTILARLISPYEMGVYAIATAVTGILTIFQACGLGGLIIRERSLGQALLTSAFTVNALICVLVAGLIAAGGLLAGGLLGDPGVGRLMLLFALLPLVGILEFSPAVLLERQANFKAIALVGSLRTLVTQGLSVALAFGGNGTMSIAYGQIGGTVFCALAYNWVARRQLRYRFGLAEWRRVTTFGLQMLTISGVNAAAARISDVLLGRIAGLSALGLYGRAAAMNSLIQDNVYLVIVRVLFVDLAEQVRAGKPLRTSYLLTVEILTGLLWPAFAGLAVVAGPFIRLAYGPRWVAAATPLMLLALASMLRLTISMSWQLFVVRHQVARQTRIELVRGGVGLTTFGIGCAFGLAGAAAGRLVELAITVAMYRPHIERMTETSLRDFVPLYQRSAILTLHAIAPAMLVMSLHGWSSDAPILQLSAAILCGITLWLGAVIWLDHPLARELRRLAIRPVAARG